jgi:hypothetical protein
VQHRKSIAAILAVLVVGIVAPVMIPKGHADDQYENLTVSGFLTRDSYDYYYGNYVSGVAGGSTLTFTLYFVAYWTPVFQRNVTLGVKFDWMTTFQNTTTYVPILTNGNGYVTLSFSVPTTAGLNAVPHSYTVEAWDLPIGGTWNANNGCYDTGYTSCRQFTGYNVVIYSSAQASAIQNIQLAATEADALSAVLSSTKQAVPGTSTAVADLAAASVQVSLAQTAYNRGDFATAQTDSQNAVNQVNAAQSSLATVGGGTDAATMTNIWLGGVAVIMGGIAALLLSFGGFKYLRGKTRALPSYAPATIAKS